MDRQEWLTNAAYFIHMHAPAITAEHADDLADDLYGSCAADLEPSEAVQRFFFAMGPSWNGLPAGASDRHQIQSYR
jgi:hypothetical protein